MRDNTLKGRRRWYALTIVGVSDVPAPGEILAGKYRIERVLGEGGMGVVYAAHHQLLAQRVAIKVLREAIADHSEARARFLNEARLAAEIQNEHVARVLDVGILESGVPFIVLEYLDGSDLADLLHAAGELAVEDVVDYLLQAICAVAQAHALGIIHRDLKPANLFLARRQDGTTQIKVLDFGISKATGGAAGATAQGHLTGTNAVLGSPVYMSPEQLRASKNVDVRSDIWALGVIAYELLTGALPFEGDNVVDLFAAIQETEPRRARDRRPRIPAALDAAVMRCLRPKPAERFASVAELAEALAPYGTRVSLLALERVSRILSASGGAPFELPPRAELAEPAHSVRPGDRAHPPRASAGDQPRRAGGRHVVEPGEDDTRQDDGELDGAPRSGDGAATPADKDGARGRRRGRRPWRGGRGVHGRARRATRASRPREPYAGRRRDGAPGAERLRHAGGHRVAAAPHRYCECHAEDHGRDRAAERLRLRSAIRCPDEVLAKTSSHEASHRAAPRRYVRTLSAHSTERDHAPLGLCHRSTPCARDDVPQAAGAAARSCGGARAAQAGLRAEEGGGGMRRRSRTSSRASVWTLN